MSAATPRVDLRRLRPRRRRHLQRLQFLHARRERRQGPGVRAVHDRHARLQHRLEQRRAERRRGVAAERRERLAAHAARRSRAGDDPRRLLGGLRARRGSARSPASSAPIPGSTLSLTRDANTGLVRPASRGRCCCARRTGSTPAPFPETPTFPIAVRPNRADNINAFHPDIEVAVTRARWTVGFQRALDQEHGGRSSATSARAASTSGRRSITTSAT